METVNQIARTALALSAPVSPELLKRHRAQLIEAQAVVAARIRNEEARGRVLARLVDEIDAHLREVRA